MAILTYHFSTLKSVLTTVVVEITFLTQQFFLIAQIFSVFIPLSRDLTTFFARSCIDRGLTFSRMIFPTAYDSLLVLTSQCFSFSLFVSSRLVFDGLFLFEKLFPQSHSLLKIWQWVYLFLVSSGF